MKISPENLWAKANASKVDEALAEYQEDNPDKSDIAARRTVVCKMFKDLPSKDQAAWKRQAEEEKQLQSVAVAAPLSGDARNK